MEKLITPKLKYLSGTEKEKILKSSSGILENLKFCLHSSSNLIKFKEAINFRDRHFSNGYEKDDYKTVEYRLKLMGGSQAVRCARLNSSFYFLTVETKENEIIGYVEWSYNKANILYLHNIAISKEYRKFGLSTVLFSLPFEISEKNACEHGNEMLNSFRVAEVSLRKRPESENRNINDEKLLIYERQKNKIAMLKLANGVLSPMTLIPHEDNLLYIYHVLYRPANPSLINNETNLEINKAVSIIEAFYDVLFKFENIKPGSCNYWVKLNIVKPFLLERIYNSKEIILVNPTETETVHDYLRKDEKLRDFFEFSYKAQVARINLNSE